MSDLKVDLSIVTTLYRSSIFIDEFVRRVTVQAEKITANFEIVFVDDGSPDDSLAKSVNLALTNPRIKVVELSRNFGHHKAMMTAVEHASGSLIFLIDVDLEEPPELLAEFHQKLISEGWDVVYGYQNKRKGGAFERVSGRIAWILLDSLTPVKIPHNHSTVRLMTRNYAQALIRHKEHKTAIGGLWVQTGFRQIGVGFSKSARDISSYRFRSRLTALLDSITSFSERPLIFVFFLGAGIFGLSALVSFSLLLLWLTGKTLPGWISVMASVWLLGGLVILSIGIVGLYTSRIFIETKHRPFTIVREIHQQLK
jgi:putative glycosyltransferase